MNDQGPFFAALDFGTGGAKCAIFDMAGQRLAVAREAWSYESAPHEHEQLNRGARFEPQAFWSALARCCQRAVAEADVPASGIAAVASSAQRLGTVFLDASDTEVFAAPNIDGRGLAGGFEIMETLDVKRAVQIGGHWPPMISSLARLLSFQRDANAPRVSRILTLNDWMNFRLSGEVASEASNAGESMLLDIASRSWSQEILELFRVEEKLLPPLLEPGSALGRVSPQAAEETGLLAGTPVVVGGADTQCALLGASVLEEGHAAAVLGTTTPVMVAEATARFDKNGKLWSGCHVLGNRWTIESNVGDTGNAFEWLLSLLGLEGTTHEINFV